MGSQSPHWSPAPQKRRKSFSAGGCNTKWQNGCHFSALNISDKGILLLLTLTQNTSAALLPLQELHSYILSDHYALLKHFAGERNESFGRGSGMTHTGCCPLSASQPGMRMPFMYFWGTHGCKWKLKNGENVWHCGKGPGAAAQRGHKTTSVEILTLVHHDFRDYCCCCCWVFCCFVLILESHVIDVLPSARRDCTGSLERQPKGWIETLVKSLNMLYWHAKNVLCPLPQ